MQDRKLFYNISIHLNFRAKNQFLKLKSELKTLINAQCKIRQYYEDLSVIIVIYGIWIFKPKMNKIAKIQMNRNVVDWRFCHINCADFVLVKGNPGK